MVLPADVSKGSGLMAALDRLQLAPLNVVGVGDAENDQIFLQRCGCAVAVANALPMVKESADFVTEEPDAAGVAALASQIVTDDLASVIQRLRRQGIELARDENDQPVTIWPQGGGLLIAGVSGAGKSTIAMGLLERLAGRGFQFCVIDPEGDYAEVNEAVSIGDAEREARSEEAIELLRQSKANVVINFIGISLSDWPRRFAEAFSHLGRLRAETARPTGS